jgi:hypothetical protein
MVFNSLNLEIWGRQSSSYEGILADILSLSMCSLDFEIFNLNLQVKDLPLK